MINTKLYGDEMINGLLFEQIWIHLSAVERNLFDIVPFVWLTVWNVDELAESKK